MQRRVAYHITTTMSIMVFSPTLAKRPNTQPTAPRQAACHESWLAKVPEVQEVRGSTEGEGEGERGWAVNASPVEDGRGVVHWSCCDRAPGGGGSPHCSRPPVRLNASALGAFAPIPFQRTPPRRLLSITKQPQANSRPDLSSILSSSHSIHNLESNKFTDMLKTSDKAGSLPCRPYSATVCRVRTMALSRNVVLRLATLPSDPTLQPSNPPPNLSR